MKKQSLNTDWRFLYGEPIDRRWREIDESQWRTVDLPHDWSIEMDRDPDAPSGASNGFFPMGRGYYRKAIEVPEEWRGKKVFVEFEGVYMNAEVKLNENYLGRHPYGYTSFVFDLTPYLRYGEKNELRVKVDNAGQMNSRWYSGSGIYRPVWLLVAEPVHVAHWGVSVTTPEVGEDSAVVQIRSRVMNETGEAREVTVRARIFDPDGAAAGEAESTLTLEAGSEREFDQVVRVSAPRLWSIETPVLYQAEVEVSVGGETVDNAATTFGIRTISVSAETGFLLNGKPVKMKGGCVHHDNGVLGAASYRRSEERKVELHKASGYNTIRCAHNPPSPAFLDACDRLGMLVIDEAFDCWREGKNPFDYHVAFDDWWQRDIESMVLRDRNHPSVVVWSIGNEVMERDGRSGGEQIARALADYTRKLDPTRPVTAAICGVWDQHRTWEDTDVVFKALDIGGYNYQWQMYEPDHERHPERVMFGTESFPLEALENWQQVEKHSYVIGDFVWTSLDYLGESGIGRQDNDGKADFLGEFPWHQANCGDIDLCGFKRPQSYYRDKIWGVGEKLSIFVHHPVPEGKTPAISRWGWPDVSACWNWAGHEGKTFKVDVYSACDAVELFLNGESLGVKPTTRAEKLTASFEVPYQPGELRAVGFIGGEKAAEAVLATTGAPEAVRLTPDHSVIPAEHGSLCYVTVEVVDADGCMVPDAANMIYFTVKGEGEIAAVGSSDPTNTEPYRGNRHSVYRGRCLVVVKSNGKAGEIRLRAQGDQLDAAEIVIRAA